MVPQLGPGPGCMIPRKRVGAGVGMWHVDTPFTSRGEWDDVKMCKKNGGRDFEVSAGTYSKSDEMCKNPLGFFAADSGLTVDAVSSACEGKGTGIQGEVHMTDMLPNLPPESLPFGLQNIFVAGSGNEIYNSVNGSRVDESKDETAGCNDDEPDIAFEDFFSLLENESGVQNEATELVSHKTISETQITVHGIPEEAIGFPTDGAEDRHFLSGSSSKESASKYELQSLFLQESKGTDFSFCTPTEEKLSVGWTSHGPVGDHDYISLSSPAHESPKGASEGLFGQSEDETLYLLSSPDEDSWHSDGNRLQSGYEGVLAEESQVQPPFGALTMYAKSDGLSLSSCLDFQIDHERPTQNYGSVLASSTSLSGNLCAIDLTGTVQPTGSNTGMLSKAPSMRSSVVDLTAESDGDDDVEFLSASAYAGVLGKRRIGEICDPAVKKRMAVSVAGGSSNTWKPRPKPVITDERYRQALDFRSTTYNSVRAPEARPLHWDLLGPSYSPERSALTLSMNANMVGGRSIPPLDRGGSTHVTASFDAEHNRSIFEAQSMAYQYSNPAGLSNPISTGPREDKAAKALKAILQQTAMVENHKETVVDPGLLSVELLKHQRIALNWMEEREAKMGLPYGGILADDQGLGKTISTISLILKARAPIRKKAVETSDSSPFEAATVDLGDDDDSHPLGVNIFDTSAGEKSNTKGQATEGLKRAVNGTGEDVKTGSKGRPAAGTLVVCPTSVLRQWGSELKEKVTEAADLSVLVYHGSSRTKDPEELAKYDVVLTTYSIVSMEVPKQPLPDEQDADKKNPNDLDVPPPFRPSKPKKPKKTGDNAKKTRGNGKGRFVEGENGSIDSGPLARVNWFRVVLDEAQSIKNSRTQVARAAWGLRAKRRWCLSGTPIQNAIDDLYSYFRFLRYTPYDGFRTFREKIKDPVNRHPEEGYKALQSLLSAVMLRRTKDTLIDGQPIVNLPQRIVTLKQTEFSEDERMFYSNLEIESRKQFQGYADAGTVQSNYVNILWMLLRLRQACDHPLLVKGHKAQSAQKIVMDSARALQPELRIQLLNLLESNRDICPLCNDPPDDAVVCICTHIFCRQCISEQLATGDDNCCPVPKCKKQLNLSLIFPLACLKSCSGDAGNSTSIALLGDGTSEDVRHPEEAEWRPSSKINAVIDTLNALPKVTVLVENGKVVAEISEGCSEVNIVNMPEVRIRNRKLPSSEEAVTTTEAKISADVKDEINPCSSLSTQTSTSVTQASGSGGTEDAAQVVDVVKCKDTVNRVFVQSTEKAIVFSQWTSMLDLLEISLKQANFNYRRLDGTMSVLARDRAVAEFKALPEVTVIIMSLKAASLGLNMVAACHVLLLDVWWNPTTEDQAIDRAHRIGQKKTVRVSRFTVRNTIEDRILALQERKRQIVASAFGEGEAGGQKTTRLSAADLEYLFRL
ncbi:hypothetical protein R1sor_027050 [Riccia sorocarpa]|uniref:Helicase-like transcription factor CHR28 n=1 Tax=Riccia sorocarpa TaxID=122646 RepID=A0ABD3GD36_9MARC